MKTVLYPWTKPEVVYDGNYSWNTEEGGGRDGKLSDWWFAFPDLKYKYDVFLTPYKVNQKVDTDISNYPFYQEDVVEKVGLTLENPPKHGVVTFNVPMKGGQYILKLKNDLTHEWDRVAIRNVLNGAAIGCGNCMNKNNVTFEISHIYEQHGPKDFQVEWNGHIWNQEDEISIKIIDYIDYEVTRKA
jgi:hypothetical protein